MFFNIAPKQQIIKKLTKLQTLVSPRRDKHQFEGVPSAEDNT